MVILFIILTSILSIIIFFIFYTTKTKSNTDKKDDNTDKKTYDGLVLFDIDGTLASNQAKINYDIVKECLDNNFAVGICTAGSYSMTKDALDTVYNTYWMPTNLYDFIISKNNITFNNVNGNYNILKGQPDLSAYSKNKNTTAGYLKGFALEQTANALGITNHGCMILCDDTQIIIDNALVYNSDFNIVCSGINCSRDKNKKLNITDVKQAMSKCKMLKT